jgi:sodium-dependent phosphate transporter
MTNIYIFTALRTSNLTMLVCFSNAIGPLITIWMIYTEGSVQQKSETPLYILFYGGVGMSVGLWVYGQRVMKTIGEDLTKIATST